MKPYIVTTGVAFGLLAAAHVARVFAEGMHLVGQPIFLATTVGSVGICIWAIVLLRKLNTRALGDSRG